MLAFAVAVFPYSQSCPPTSFAWGSSSLSCRTWVSVSFFLAWISGEGCPNCTAGSRWIWNAFAPSSPSCLSIDFRSPFRSAIIATTVNTPMTMPSSVSPERNLWEDSESSARRRSSSRPVHPRRKRTVQAGAAMGGA